VVCIMSIERCCTNVRIVNCLVECKESSEISIYCKVIPHRRALTLRAAKGFYPFGNPDKVTLCQEHRDWGSMET
jgi:hypothetical protein